MISEDPIKFLDVNSMRTYIFYKYGVESNLPGGLGGGSVEGPL